MRLDMCSTSGQLVSTASAIPASTTHASSAPRNAGDALQRAGRSAAGRLRGPVQ